VDRREIARMGGLARARALSPERRSEIARMGYEALVAKRFGGNRKATVKHLEAGGKIEPTRPATAEELHELHRRLMGATEDDQA
jgi:general stress protein YciG